MREAFEETGLHVELTGIAGVYGGPEFETVYRNGDRVSYLMVVFEGLRTGGSLRPDREETLDLRFFALEEIRAVRTPRWLSEVLEGVFAGSTRAAFRAPSWSPPSESSPDSEPRS